MSESLTFVEVDVDYCSLTYGVAPCTASLVSSPPTGTIKCFNCRNTCQDIANYDDDGATLRYAIDADYLPLLDIEAIPSIQSIQFTPAIVSLNGDLGQRASLKVTFKDHPHPDAGTGYDKYLSDRSYNPYTQGTYWGRFRARHPFLQGRDIRVIRGLLGQTLAEMETRHYVIESFDGPSYDGLYTIVAKDVLKLADGDRAQAPALNSGVLSAAISDTDIGLILSPSGVGDDEYQSSGYLNLGSEAVAFVRYYVGNDSATKVLLHFDGANGGATFTDSNAGGSAHTFTPTNATTSTAAAKFAQSGLFAAGYVTTADHADFTLGSGNLTIDFWINRNSDTGAKGVAGQGNSTATAGTTPWKIEFNGSNQLVCTFSSGGPGFAFTLTYATAITDAVWRHIAIVRSGNVWTLYVDGVAVATDTQSLTLLNSTNNLSVGRVGEGGTAFTGYIDEFRLSVGVARWTTPFSPPTEAYSASQSSSGDFFIITRSQLNTEADAHEEGDRAQEIERQVAQDPADILYRWLTVFAGVNASLIDLDAWQTETDNFYGRLLTGSVAEPTSVNQLITEILDIIGGVMWWDDRSQLLRFQILRQIQTDAAIYSADNRMEDSFELSEQPEKRLTRVQTYFAPVNPLLNLDQVDNYRSIVQTIDEEAERDYGVKAIRLRFTRWIPEGGAAIAQASNQLLLSRFRTPPRRFSFDLFREYSALQDPVLGAGYQLRAWNLQDATGAPDAVPIQITRLNPNADRFQIEAEEVRFLVLDVDPTDRPIIIDSNTFNINLRTLHDALYPEPESGDTVTLSIYAGVIIGSINVDTPALDIGSWPSGVTIVINGSGRIQGAGGKGASILGPSSFVSAKAGGVALYTRYAIEIDWTSGELWGGGGGGGLSSGPGAYAAGGGGAGTLPGDGGTGAPAPSFSGLTGTATDGGGGGDGVVSGGDPGDAGINGNILVGAAAGAAVDGDSYVTWTNTPDIQGSQVN